MYRILYSLVFYLLLPFIYLRLAYRALSAPAYRQRWAERAGWFECPSQFRGGAWFHTVSVGETLAAVPMVRRFMADHPNVPVIITTMTPTGSERVRAIYGDTVFHVYAPYDFPGALRRFLARVQPSMLVIMETELWPNMLYHTHLQGVPVYLVNARLSERSAAGYAKVSGLTREMLVCLEHAAIQTGVEADRFRALGLPSRAISVTGSIKYDLEVPDELRAQGVRLRGQWGPGRPVLIAASTHEGEDEQVLEAFSAILAEFEDALLMIVPRHPERFDKVAAQCEAAGYVTARRSSGDACGPATQVYLGDTMGELMLMLAASDVVFVGGSLIESGGHNMLEPAALGKPVLSGPSMFNFLEISQALQDAAALSVVSGAEALANETLRLFRSDAQHQLMGEAGRKVVEANRGALERVAQMIGPGLPTEQLEQRP